jgi:dihydropteroate synthase
MNDNFTFKFRNITYDLSSRTHIMGILNITPDSFYDGGKYLNKDKAVEYALKMVKDGADIIDVGGQSSRPGSDEVSVEEEINRTVDVINILSKELKIPISIDTYRSIVANEALRNGAEIVNDISAFNLDEKMPEIIASHKASCILMHMKGTPKTMQDNPVYDDFLSDVQTHLEKSIWKANVAGIDQVVIDPGIGFGKTVDQNLLLIKNIKEFKKFDCPVLIGVSRKSLIGNVTSAGIDERLPGSIALSAVSIINGVNILRTHDVKETVQAVKLIDKYLKL